MVELGQELIRSPGSRVHVPLIKLEKHTTEALKQRQEHMPLLRQGLSYTRFSRGVRHLMPH